MIKGNLNSKEIVGGIVLVALFVAASALARNFYPLIGEYLDFGIAGMVVYVLGGTVIAFFAPPSIIPLIPVASALWGPLVTSFLNILIWTSEAVIAFVIARYLGQPFVARFVDMDKISRYEKILGDKNIFWNIAFLRFAMPVDLVSYAVGLFTSVRPGIFLVASVAGIIPFSFLVTYASSASLGFQILVGAGLLLLLYVGYRKIRKIANSERPSTSA